MSSYRNSTHYELYASATGAAGVLRISADVQELIAKGKPVTWGQRRLIRPAAAYEADRTLADLLDALARQVHHGQHIEGDAQQLLLDPANTLLSVFGPLFADQQRNARHHVILEAANIVLRKDAEEWLHGGAAGTTPHDRALASNRGLAAVLGELEALRTKGRQEGR